MELQITAKNTELPPAALTYADKKLGKLDKHLLNIIEANVEITEENTKAQKDRYIVQVTINTDGTLLRGEERGVDVFTAIDKVAKVMNGQIERYKGKLNHKSRGFSPIRGTATESPSVPIHKLVKTKKFSVKPMSPGEAIDQMELLGHTFFLFYNTDTKKLNLVYQRKDKNYGLIDPDME